jgi:hypothetical protein
MSNKSSIHGECHYLSIVIKRQLRAPRAEFLSSQRDCSDVASNGLAASRMFLVCSLVARRSQRSDMPPDRGAILDALDACRTAMILGVQSKVRVNGPVYVAANAVVTAIDALAAQLTGDPQFFWDKDAPSKSTPPAGEDA